MYKMTYLTISCHSTQFEDYYPRIFERFGTWSWFGNVKFSHNKNISPSDAIEVLVSLNIYPNIKQPIMIIIRKNIATLYLSRRNWFFYYVYKIWNFLLLKVCFVFVADFSPWDTYRIAYQRIRRMLPESRYVYFLQFFWKI